jgi:excisionase family DNA binding protein
MERAFDSSAGAPGDRKGPLREIFVPEPLLDSWEAAAMMKVHPKTLQKLARRGQVPGIHVGKLWRFRASVIEAWIDQQMVG